MATYNNISASLYSFTGKERDAETGYSYFGARYYDSDLSGLFLSVDPMADKYPSISPYAYCAWNPLRLIDPDGRKIKGVTYNENTGEYSFTDDALNNGLDKYINIRTQTKSGKKSIEQMIKDGREFDVSIIDNPLFVNDDGKYYQLNGVTIGNKIIISTCLDKKSGEVSDAMVVDPDNNIYNRTVVASEKKIDFKSKDPAILAYFDSGLYTFNKKHPYRNIEELINGVGSHEEAHLFQKNEVRADTYRSEYDAYRKEKKSRKEYLHLHP